MTPPVSGTESTMNESEQESEHGGEHAGEHASEHVSEHGSEHAGEHGSEHVREPATEPKVAEASAETAAAAPRRGRSAVGRLWGRVWGTNDEDRARANAVTLSERQTGDLRRAFAVRELAESSMMSTGRNEALATTLPALVGLAREAAFWSLAASVPDPAPTDAADALARTSPELLAELVPDEAARERVRAALTAPQGDALWARRTPEEQEQAFTELGALSSALLDRITLPRRRLQRARLRRVLLGLGVIALAFGAKQLVTSIQLGSSLTAGRPWRASSALDICKPKEHYCADAVTDIFFCTTDEVNPWVEYDLGEQRTFSRLVVKNRSDCCPDRAVPLILEVSDDQSTWREVARRDDTFSTWRADFPATRARYARLRVARRSILHLDRFDLYR